MKDKPRLKDREHIQYHLANGTRVPGATTITSVLDKGEAIKLWANRLGFEHINVRTYVDGLADIGTLAHYKIARDLDGGILDPLYMQEFSQRDQDASDTCLLKYLDWRKGRSIKPVLVEQPLVSERYRYGGTADLLAWIDGVLTLVDLKTCKGLYGRKDEKWTQLAGYYMLVREHGHDPQAIFILRVGRDDSEGFEYTAMPSLTAHCKRFLLCRRLYEINKELGRTA